MERPQNKNLIPQAHKLTLEEQSRAGKASGEARRAKKTMKEYAENLLACLVKDSKLTAQLSQMGMKPENGETFNYAEAILIRQVVQAIKGDTRAYKAIMDTIEPKKVEDNSSGPTGATDPGEVVEEIKGLSVRAIKRLLDESQQVENSVEEGGYLNSLSVKDLLKIVDQGGSDK